MNDKSILEQIITNHQAEEVARLDAIEIIDNLFNELNNREQDVLRRRFGLHGQTKQTLEEIGKVHKLTRERIRQIEATGIKKLRQLENLESIISGLKKVIIQLLEEHGGLMEKDYLFNNLVNFSVGEIRSKTENEQIHKSHFDFLISKLLSNEFEEITGSNYFKDSFKLKYQTLDHLEALAEELLEKINQTRRLFLTEDLINFSKELVSYKNNQEKFSAPNNLNLADVFKKNPYPEKAEIINANKVIYSILQAAKKIEQNKFGHWGAYDWREIKPKTINDKIYLVLKNHGKPMHFVEIAEKINQISFDKKKANPATVHNELILEDKYILVGRGLYGLKEWGFNKGTVSEIIEQVLIEAEKPLSREEIISKVLEQRLVKKATINLALMNKSKFERLGGKYNLVGNKTDKSSN